MTTGHPLVDYRESAPADWPDVLVLVDEQRLSGELRAWIRTGDAWGGDVRYREAPDRNHLARFPGEAAVCASRISCSSSSVQLFGPRRSLP